MKIFVKILSTGKVISLDFTPNDNVEEIKNAIACKESVPSQQMLIFAGKKLENDKTLSDYHIEEQCTLMLVTKSKQNVKNEKPNDEMQLVVKTLTGKTLKFNVRDRETVQDIKLKIQNSEYIPIEQQRLIFNKKTLANDKLLSYYQIKNNSVLHLVLDLKPLKSREKSIPNMCSASENINDNWAEYMRLLNNINWKNIPTSYTDTRFNDQNLCCDILKAIDTVTNNTPSKIRNRSDFIATLQRCERFDICRALNKTALNVYEAFKPFIDDNLQIMNVEMTDIELHSDSEEEDLLSDSDSEYAPKEMQPNDCCVGCTACIVL